MDKNIWKYKARGRLVGSLIENIDINKDVRDFYLRAFYAVVTVRLHMKTQQEGLLKKELWLNPTNKKELIGKIRTFLWNNNK